MNISKKSFLYKWLTFISVYDAHGVNDSCAVIRHLIRVSILSILASSFAFYFAYAITFNLVLLPYTFGMQWELYFQIFPHWLAVPWVLFVGLIATAFVVALALLIVYIYIQLGELKLVKFNNTFKLYDSWKNKYCIPVTYD